MTVEALFYNRLEENKVQCSLCPHFCIIREGQSGICHVRSNKGGKLFSEVYGHVSCIQSDPIEKKPLFHFYPGSKILSVGSFGCNLKCRFCQNSSISQTSIVDEKPQMKYSPEQIVELAANIPGNTGIAFTYNEPFVWFEYMLDIARLANKAGLKTAIITNGYINSDPLNLILPYIDAFNIDLKGFNEDFYIKMTSSNIDPVLQVLRQIKTAGKHLEITNLIIPGMNDDDTSISSMSSWIATELSTDTVLHLSRYFPDFKLTVEATPAATILKAQRIAKQFLTYVYTGNLYSETNNTFCKNCNNLLISRHSYNIVLSGLDSKGNCNSCGTNFLKKT